MVPHVPNKIQCSKLPQATNCVPFNFNIKTWLWDYHALGVPTFSSNR